MNIMKTMDAMRNMKNALMHYGTPRHSGRYPWGSGDNPYQHCSYFMSEVKRLRKDGYSDNEIAKMMNMSSGEFRSKISISKEEQRISDRNRATELKEKGYSNVKIGEIMGIPESSVRNLLNPNSYKKATPVTDAALFLKDQVDAKGLIDVGTGVDLEMGISETVLDAAINKLREDGYECYSDIRVEQMTNPGKYTILRVLAPPDTTKGDVYRHVGDIQSVESYDIGAKLDAEKHPGFAKTKYGMYYPQSIDSDRVMVRYSDEGGLEKDGVIELRRGVEDISLGKSNYAQVRIAVDDQKYLKGMAMYMDDETAASLPPGVDVIFNSHEPTGTEKMSVFKQLKEDRDNPFGAAIKSEDKGGQRFYTDENGKEHLSCINIVNQEGDWGDWSKTLSSQFLSKQNMPLIKQQLDLSYSNKLDQYRDICALQNPTIKQKLLESFASDCDASAVHLKAASLPGQCTHVILPVLSLGDKEVYAPKYENGQTVVLIRYPHEGTFEIPELKVNNKNKEGLSSIGNATDCIGINATVAAQLSGADFDGDSVMLIPVSKGSAGTKIKADDPLPQLKNFRTDEYKLPEDAAPCNAAHGFYKQKEMGRATNLITDMTLLGATNDEIARAVKHAMVVIDTEKHHLNWKQSYIDNGIAELKEKYQGGANRGAATLISRASSDYRIPVRKKDYSGSHNSDISAKVKNGINVETGEEVYYDTGETYDAPIFEYTKNAEGKRVRTGKKLGYNSDKQITRTTTTTKMAATNDAFTLVSEARHPVEVVYANYANSLKALANTARKEMINTQSIPYSKEAKEKYADQVISLQNKLTLAKKNAPRERQALVAATAIYNIKKSDNPDMTNEEKKKVKSQAMAEQRVRYGAKKNRVDISDDEWEAIQSGAIHTQMLRDILNNTDMDKLKERAMPKDYQTNISDFKKSRIEAMSNKGYSLAEIADAVGLSASTVANVLKS